MALTEAQKKALAAFNGEDSVAPVKPGLTDAQTKALAEFSNNNPPAPSPYDTWGGTAAELGKVLGSGLMQMGTGIAGMPGQAGEEYNKLLSQLPPEWQQTARQTVGHIIPSAGIVGAARATGLPTAPEMDAYLQDKGVMHKPINAAEDWAQYLISNAATAAIPMTKGGTIGNMVKEGAVNAAKSIIPASTAKAASDLMPNVPGAGLVASLLGSLAQHGAGRLARPGIGVAQDIAADLPDDAVKTLEEAQRLKVPSKVVDMVRPDSYTEHKLHTVAGANPRKAAVLTGSLQARNADAPVRMQEQIEKSVGMGPNPPTGKEHRTLIKNLAEKDVDAVYGDIRSSSADAESAGARRWAEEQMQNRSVELTPLQKVIKEAKGFLYRPQGASKVPIPNYEAGAAMAARDVVEKAMAEDPSLREGLQPLHDKLTEAIKFSHPELEAADAARKNYNERVAASKAGGKAGAARAKDAIQEYDSFDRRLDPSHSSNLKNSYRLSYADNLVKRVGNVKPGDSATAPIGSVGQTEKMKAILNDDVVKARDLEKAAHDAHISLTNRKGAEGGLIQAAAKRLGHNTATLSAATFGMGNVLAHPGLATTVVGLGIMKFLRDGARSKSLLKAMGISDPKELQKLLDKAGKASTVSGDMGRAGLINMISGH
jgi:hypothetical protein